MVSTTVKIGKAVPWSYSSLTAYETCPRRFYLTRISRQVQEKQTAATTHGNEVHEALELAVAGTKGLDPKYAQHQPLVDKLRAAPGKKLTEYKFGLTSDLRPTEFFGKDVWVRGVLDLSIVRTSTATLLDYKTGKRKMDVDQLEMFAMAGFALWPHVNTIKTGYIWLQSGKLDAQEFTREQKIEIHRNFASRVHRMEASQQNDSWPPRPSGLCREWCPVGRSLCEHCGS